MDENYIRPNIVNTITVVLMVIVGMTLVRATSSFVKNGLAKGVSTS